MKRIGVLAIGLVMTMSSWSCAKDKNPKATEEGASKEANQSAQTTQPAAQQQIPGAQAPQAGMPPAGGQIEGEVLETMNASGYTYIHVNTGTEKIWAAAPEFACKVGDKVTMAPGTLMQNFHSSTLNRDFEKIFFVPFAGQKGAAAPAAPAAGSQPFSHPPMGSAAAGSKEPVKGVAKAEGGKTVAEIYAEKDGLAGKEIKVRGKVVKFSPQIMGKNWVHIQDGSGSTGTNDLTVTTNAQATVGDVVLISGKLSVNRDFGAGYTFQVIIEDASVSAK